MGPGSTQGLRPMQSVRAVLALTLGWLFTAAWWSLYVALALLTWRRLPSNLTVWFQRWWGKIILWLCGVRLILEGPSTLQGRQGRVVVINHQSVMELAWGAVIAPPGLTALGKRELAWVPVINVVWWALGFFLVDRARPGAAGAQALRNIADMVRSQARSLVIAPEGTRSPSGELGPFKSGAFRVAMEAGVPVYPVVVDGAFDVWPRHARLPRPGTIRVRFLPPVDTSGWTRQTLRDEVERIRSAMSRALEDMRQ